MEFVHDRHIRVFLSSTFADMQEERDYLVKNTFPAIKRLCTKRNVDFSVVDLRWGVTEEEAHSGKVIEICVDEIQRTHPFFIGLVGGRYGWIPQKEDLQLNQRILNKYPWIKDSINNRLSITEIEMQYGVLKNPDKIYANFFIRNDKSVPSHFREQPNSIEAKKLSRLKDAIYASASTGHCQANQYNTPKELGKLVYTQLSALLDELYPTKAINTIEYLCETQRAISIRLQKVYKNRITLNELNAKLSPIFSENRIDNQRVCVLVSGDNGCGKSALLANYLKDEPRIIRTFLNSNLNTCEKAIEHLQAELEIRGYNISTNLIWFVDGIEHLASDEDRTLNKFENLDLNFVFSTSDSLMKKCVHAFANRCTSNLEEIRISRPSVDEIISICKSYLQQFAKGLSERQFTHIANHQIFSNIKLLRIFLDELIQFGVFEQLDSFMNKYLSQFSEEGILQEVLNRLETDYSHETVRTFFGMLSITEIGLPEEILQHECRLNNVDWSSFYTAIANFISLTNGLISINDSTLNKIISERYTTNHTEVAKWHSIVIDCYKRLQHDMIEADCPLFERIVHKTICRIVGLPIITILDESHELAYQQLSFGINLLMCKSGQADTLFKRMNIISLLDFCRSELLPYAMNYLDRNADKIARFINNRNIILLSSHDLLRSSFSFIYSTILQGDKDKMIIFRKKIAHKIVLPYYRQQTLQTIDKLLTDTANSNIEDSWEEMPLEKIRPDLIISFFIRNLLFTLSMKRIKHVEQKVDMLLERLENKKEFELMHCLLISVKSYCQYRHGAYNEAFRLYNQSVQECSLIDNLYPLSFIINLALGNYDECQSLIDIQANQCHQISNFNNKASILEWVYRMKISLASRNQDTSALDSTIDQLVSLYDRIDIPNHEERKYSALFNAAIWCLTQNQNSEGARLAVLAANATNSVDNKIYCYDLACKRFLMVNLFNKAIDAGTKAVSLHRQQVPDPAKQNPDYLDNLQECYLRSQNYPQWRHSLEQLSTIYKHQSRNNYLWALGEIASSYRKEADAEIMRTKTINLYHESVKVYDQILNITNGNNDADNIIRQINRAEIIGYGAFVYKAWSSDDNIVQHNADRMIEIYHLITHDNTLRERTIGIEHHLAYCLAAADRYSELKPLIKDFQIDSSIIYAYDRIKHGMRAADILRIPWTHFRYSPNVQSISLRNIAKWWKPELEQSAIPFLCEIVEKHDKEYCAYAIAMLIFYYLITEQHDKLQQLKSIALSFISKYVDSNIKQTYLPLIMYCIIDSDDINVNVTEEMLFDKLILLFPEKAKYLQATFTIIKANEILFLGNTSVDKETAKHSIKSLFDALNILRAHNSRNIIDCYTTLFSYIDYFGNLSDILSSWKDVESDGLADNYNLRYFKGIALCYTGFFDEGNNCFRDLISETNDYNVAEEFLQILVKEGRIDEALQQFSFLKDSADKYQSNEYHPIELWGAIALSENGQHIEALQLLEQDTLRNTDNPQRQFKSQLVRIYCFLQQGNLNDALTVYSSIPSFDNCNQEIFLYILIEMGLITSFVRDSNIEQAIKHRASLDNLLNRYHYKDILKERIHKLSQII